MREADKQPSRPRGLLLKLLSPRAMLIVAVLSAQPYLVGQLLGWREYTSFICGNLPATDTQLALGLIYVVSYLTFVLAVPILALAAAILALLQRVFPES